MKSINPLQNQWFNGPSVSEKSQKNLLMITTEDSDGYPFCKRRPNVPFEKNLNTNNTITYAIRFIRFTNNKTYI